MEGADGLGGEATLGHNATIPAPEWVALIGDGPARGWRHPSAIGKPLAGRGRVCRPSPSHHTHGDGMQLDTTVGAMGEWVTGGYLSRRTRDAMVVQYVACILVYYVRGQGPAVAFSSRSRRLKIGICLSVSLLVSL